MNHLLRAMTLPEHLYERLCAWVIPTRADYEERWRARIGVGILMSSMALMTLVSLFNLVISLRVAMMSLFFVSILVLGTLVHKWTGQVRWGVYTIATITWLGTSWLALHKGGLQGAPLNWAPLATLGIVLMLGRTHGSLLWTLLFSTQSFLFVLLVDPATWPESMGPPWTYALMRAGICWAAFWMAGLLEKQRWRAYQTLYESQQRLQSTHREMTLLLDNAEQGFVTLDQRGALCGDHTAALERWFGPITVGMPFEQMLARCDVDLARRWRQVWDKQAHQQDLLPQRLHSQERTLTLRYQPLAGSPECCSHLLVILTDITQDQLQHEAERQRREVIALYADAMRDPARAMDFWDHAEALIQELHNNPASHQQRWLLRQLEDLAQRRQADALVRGCQQALETGHTRHATRAFRRAQAAVAPWLERQRGQDVLLSAEHLRELRLLLQTQAEHEEIQDYFLHSLTRRDQKRSPPAGRTGQSA